MSNYTITNNINLSADQIANNMISSDSDATVLSATVLLECAGSVTRNHYEPFATRSTVTSNRFTSIKIAVTVRLTSPERGEEEVVLNYTSSGGSSPLIIQSGAWNFSRIERFTPVVNLMTGDPRYAVGEGLLTGIIPTDLDTVDYEIAGMKEISKNLEAKTGKTKEVINLSTTDYGPELLQGKVENLDDELWPLNDGDYFTGIGSAIVTQKVTDGHGDATVFKRRINVTTTDQPDIIINYAGSEIPYKGEWLSTDASADDDRQRRLDIYTKTSVPGDYNTAIYER